MAKFILHGGNTREINVDNNGFFREITLGTNGRVGILLNYFSRDENEIEQCSEHDKQRLLQNSETKDLIFEVAKPETLAGQLQSADVMYMRGGDTEKLIRGLSLTPQLDQIFQNKVIAGSSAGVYALAKYYWSNDHKRLGDGLGILNIKTFCHYESKDTDIVDKLLNYKEDLPLLVLPNYKWMLLFH